MLEVGFQGFIAKFIREHWIGRRERGSTGDKQKKPDTNQEYGFVAETLLKDFVGHGSNAEGADCLDPFQA